MSHIIFLKFQKNRKILYLKLNLNSIIYPYYIKQIYKNAKKKNKISKKIN